MQRVHNNYGSFLQAYALKKMIEEIGHEVVFVDYHVEPCVVETNATQNIIFIQKIIRFIKHRNTVKKRRMYRKAKSFSKVFDECLPILGILNDMNYNTYAWAYSLAKKYGHKIFIISEISGYSVRQNILQKFSLDQEYVRGFWRLDWTKNQYTFRLLRKVIFDEILKLPFMYQIAQEAKNSRMYMEQKSLEKGKIYVIDGYWECHAYFDEYRKDLI